MRSPQTICVRASTFLGIALAVLLAATTASAGPGATVGLQGPAQGLDPTRDHGSATGEKPESKLFFTEDHVWWAALGTEKNVPNAGVWLFRLDPGGWTPVYRLKGSDPWGKADATYDAVHHRLTLSLRDVRPGTTDNPRRSLLYRLRYDGSGGWTVGQPRITITTAAPETLTVARDTKGRTWVAFEQVHRIRVGYLLPGTSTFQFFRVNATNVNSDDIAAVVAYGPGRIGVFWSDQESRRFLFASRGDAKAPTKTSFRTEVAYGKGHGCPTLTATGCADDHINVKAVGGTIYAAVKTSLNDDPAPNPNDPLIVLLKRTPGAGWSSTKVSPVAADYTRPIVVVRPGASQVNVLAHQMDGDTYRWTASTTAPVFGAPTPWTTSDSDTLANVTSTKQPINAATGLVAMTSTVGAPHLYWYNVA